MGRVKPNPKAVHWVKGNFIHLTIPLQAVLMSEDGGDAEAYTPPSESTIEVVFQGGMKSYSFVPTQDGDVLHITDNGELPVGSYSIIIIVREPNGRERRSRWDNILSIHCNYEDAYDATDEIPDWVGGAMLDWVTARSCFGLGYWDNDLPWLNDEAWNNGI